MPENFEVYTHKEYFASIFDLPPTEAKKANKASNKMFDNPWRSEMHYEKIRDADPGMYSSRVDRQYRIVWKHIKPNIVLMCFVDKHDEAYRRASSTTFTIEDGVVVKRTRSSHDSQAAPSVGLLGYRADEDKKYGQLFIGYTDQELLGFGVSEEQLPHVRGLDTEEQLWNIERILDESVFLKLLDLFAGIDPVVDSGVIATDKELKESLEKNHGGKDIHQFLDSEEFQRALEGNMEDWMLFLAPHQRRIVNRDYAGPARVKGVVGSGKTVVAIHRLVRLAREAHKNDQKVLFLTYGNRLPEITYHLVESLAGEGAPELDAIECRSVHSWCGRFIREHGIRLSINSAKTKECLENAIKKVKTKHPKYKIWEKPNSFFSDEISIAIKGKAIKSLEEYLALDRSGRGTSLNDDERKAMYQIYQAYQNNLGSGCGDFDDIVLLALELLEQGKCPDMYRYAVVDEIQDLTTAVMRLIRKIIPEGENDLFLVGDGLQRIYPGAYVLSRLGIDIVGRGTLLDQNYRNTQEILQAAFTLMENQTYDDLESEEAPAIKPEYSLRRGEKPFLHKDNSVDEEVTWVGAEIKRLKSEKGYQDQDFAVLFRWKRPYKSRVKTLFYEAGLPVVEVSNDSQSYFGPGIKLTTFHSSKGLEFKVVFVLGVTDTLFVPKENWDLKGDELQEYHQRERRLLYVAMTRARDLLYLSYSRGVKSRFLADVPGEYLTVV